MAGGVPAGDCARGLGVCCVGEGTTSLGFKHWPSVPFSHPPSFFFCSRPVVLSCGSSSNTNFTYFTNPGYPSAFAGGGRCTITITKSSGVDQVGAGGAGNPAGSAARRAAGADSAGCCRAVAWPLAAVLAVARGPLAAILMCLI